MCRALLKPCKHDQICIGLYVRKSGHVYAFTHVCKICTDAKVGKFAPASDQVQISFCVYAKFAYMQIWSCEQKAKFAHVSIYLIVLIIVEITLFQDWNFSVYYTEFHSQRNSLFKL